MGSHCYPLRGNGMTKTVVTDFTVVEHADMVTKEQADEYRRLAFEAGMTALVEQGDEGKIAFGYPKMTNMQKNMFKLLVPTSITLDRYKHDVPPIEALGLISRANLTGQFEKILIHFNDKLPDPIAIGYAKEEAYLICAWGPEKVSDETLMARFDRVFKDKLAEACRKTIDDATQTANTVDAQREMWLRYGWLSGCVSLA